MGLAPGFEKFKYWHANQIEVNVPKIFPPDKTYAYTWMGINHYVLSETDQERVHNQQQGLFLAPAQ